MPCTVTLDARTGQSNCIMEENGCESRQTSKEKTFLAKIYVGGFTTMLAPNTCRLNYVTLPFLLVRTVTGNPGDSDCVICD